MNDEYPDNRQRFAVCAQIWRERDKELDMDNTIYKYLHIDKSEFDEKDFVVTATASKEVIDRDGDVIKVSGIDTKNWKKNPVIMLFHNYHDFPIGLGIGKKAWVDGNELKVKFKFLIEDNEKAFQAARLWKAGALKGLSVGFKPDYSSIEYPEKKEGKKVASRIFNNVELLEVSVVPVPSNQEALMASIGKSVENGDVSEEDYNIIKELFDTEIEKEEKTVEVDEKQELEQKVVDLEAKILILEETIDKYKLMNELKEIDTEDDYLSEIFSDFEAPGADERPDGDQIEEDEYLDVFIGE
jgi:HK97 family phage prohead protease